MKSNLPRGRFSFNRDVDAVNRFVSKHTEDGYSFILAKPGTRLMSNDSVKRL